MTSGIVARHDVIDSITRSRKLNLLYLISFFLFLSHLPRCMKRDVQAVQSGAVQLSTPAHSSPQHDTDSNNRLDAHASVTHMHCMRIASDVNVTVLNMTQVFTDRRTATTSNSIK
jgi:hypothetical protein